MSAADASKSQANPVSTTEYTVLDTTKNVEVVSCAATVTGGTVQALIVRAYVDGKTIVFTVTNPVDGNEHVPQCVPLETDANQALKDSDVDDLTLFNELALRNMSGRSVKITVSCTWTVQPNPVFCRVKWRQRN